MKKSYIKLLILEFLLLSILLINSFILNILNYYTLSLVLFLVLLMSYFFVGFEKQRNRYKKDTIINIAIYIIMYLLILYFSGIFIGFVKSQYSMRFSTIVSNIIPIFIFIVICEVLRYQIATKGQGSKLVNIISVVLFINIDITLYMYQYNLGNMESIIKLIAMVLLPNISKNISLNYISFKSGYTSTMLYRMLIELYVYIAPIVPDLGEYVTSILGTIFPTMVSLSIYNLFKKEDLSKRKEDVRHNNKPALVIYIITIIFLGSVIILSSGKFKYQSFTIGSGSMVPNINIGDVIITEKVRNKKNIDINDILVYYYNNKIIVHRVVEKKILDNNEVQYYTKGDANEDRDDYIVSTDSIIGIAVLRVPYIGYPTILLNRKLNK